MKTALNHRERMLRETSGVSRFFCPDLFRKGGKQRHGCRYVSRTHTRVPHPRRWNAIKRSRCCAADQPCRNGYHFRRYSRGRQYRRIEGTTAERSKTV